MLTLQDVLPKEKIEELFSCSDQEKIKAAANCEAKTRPCLQTLPVERGGFKDLPQSLSKIKRS